MIPENKFQSPTPKKESNCANLLPGKISLDIETSGKKIIIKGSHGFLHLYTSVDKEWNSQFS